jgi:hypothetical protein
MSAPTVRKTDTTTTDKKLTRGEREARAVTMGLKARGHFWTTTRDENRTELDLFPAILRAGYRPLLWDLANGIREMDGKAIRGNVEYNSPEDPDAVLDAIEKRSKQKLPESEADRNVWILRGFAPWLEGVAGALTLRKLQNLLRPDGLSGTYPNVAQAIILLSASATPPPELSDSLTTIDWPLPDREEIAAILDMCVDVLPDTAEAGKLQTKVRRALRNGNRDAAIDAAVGLSGQEIQGAFARSIIEYSTINPTGISGEKKRLFEQAGMELMKPLPGGLDSVGALENFKDWIRKHELAWTSEARDYGLVPPTGVLLLGIPGCGKTLCAKALASAWGVPLVRLDLGSLKSKYVGESEAKLRKALKVIESLGRVVVLVDEIEKALAGATGQQADAGVSADALGTLLTFMQEREGTAFIVATANNVESLPPELMRKGRFSELFWVDLPTAREREEVLAVALRQKNRDPEALGIDLKAVASATESFSGAEIAELVPEAMYTAFGDGKRQITTDDLLHTAREVVPMARTQSEKITRLRETWSNRAKPASRADDTRPIGAAPLRGRALDL